MRFESRFFCFTFSVVSSFELCFESFDFRLDSFPVRFCEFDVLIREESACFVDLSFDPDFFNTTCLNSVDVSPGMEIAPKFSFNMISFWHGDKKTSPLCLQVYVPYGLDPGIQIQGTGEGSG